MYCRFMASTPEKEINDADIFALLQKVGPKYRWMHIEKLAEFDGKPGFTKSQGRRRYITRVNARASSVVVLDLKSHTTQCAAVFHFDVPAFAGLIIYFTAASPQKPFASTAHG